MDEEDLQTFAPTDLFPETVPTDQTFAPTDLFPETVSHTSNHQTHRTAKSSGNGGVLQHPPFPTDQTFDQWEMIGAVTPEKPSGIFRTGWSTKEDMIGCPMVQLGVSLEPYETISNLEIMNSGVDERKEFAIKIARDLFLYMTSFSQQTQMGEMLLVPTGVLDKWIERFNRKYSLDPNFMMKEQA